MIRKKLLLLFWLGLSGTVVGALIDWAAYFSCSWSILFFCGFTIVWFGSNTRSLQY